MASLAEISINRPVLAIVMSITIVIFGIIGFNFLGVREYPAVDPPIITVRTNYVGANANIIETQVTEILESSINGIAGIKSITSVSRDGASSITVEFGLEIDLEAAANDVRDRVSRVIRSLPPDINPPVVTKADANSFPIVFLTVQSEKRSLLELSDYAENVLKERLDDRIWFHCRRLKKTKCSKNFWHFIIIGTYCCTYFRIFLLEQEQIWLLVLWQDSSLVSAGFQQCWGYYIYLK